MSDKGGPLSSPPDGLFAGLTIGQQLLMGLGILLLLPGGCALFFIVTLITQSGWKAFSDVYVKTFVPLMILSLMISVGGVWIVVAVRRARGRQP